MKHIQLVPIVTREYSPYGPNDVSEAFEAGFRAAREMFANKYGDETDYLFKEDLLKLGEEEV